MKSPPRGCSTLMTSAPCSPSRPAQNGAAMRVPRSRTRRPASGPDAATVSGLLGGVVAGVAVGEDLLHGRALLAGLEGVQRGRGVVREVVGHEVVLPGLALAHELERV